MSWLTRITSIILLSFTGMTAIAGGLCLIIDPSGQLLHLSTTWLIKTPFKTYLEPGLVLFIAIGIFSLYAAFLNIKRHKYADVCLLLEGIILSIWAVVQLLTYSKTSFLQLFYGVIGITMLLLGFLMRKNRFRENLI